MLQELYVTTVDVLVTRKMCATRNTTCPLIVKEEARIQVGGRRAPTVVKPATPSTSAIKSMVIRRDTSHTMEET